MKLEISQTLNRTIQGDALATLKRLPDESVHCIVTSPPYWGLRTYGVSGQIGLEETPAEYVKKIVEVFREARRVLRKDGTAWIVIGDSYADSGRGQDKNSGLDGSLANQPESRKVRVRESCRTGLRPKNMLCLPWRVGLALQDDGWYLRMDIIWHKQAPMPESVRDRPTKAHEYVLLISKSEQYFYDAYSIMENVTGNAHTRGNGGNPKSKKTKALKQDAKPQIKGGDRMTGFNEHWKVKQNESFYSAIAGMVSMRNCRSVWTLPPAGYSGAHFAVFPPALAERCLRAGTSEAGCCSECGAPMKRVFAKEKGANGDRREYTAKYSFANPLDRMRAGRKAGFAYENPFPGATGWEATCKCGAPLRRCVILDPFMGSGTTALVAVRTGRDFIGIELNPEYIRLAEQRLHEDGMLFHAVQGELQCR